MNILLTGSTGFLGSRVFPLLSRDHQVTCFHGDLLTLRRLPAYDSIVHLAAVVPKTQKEDTQELYRKNIEMTKNLARAAGNAKILLASTIEVYGSQTGTLDEQSPVNPTTWYGKSKLACERLLPDAMILRFSVLYGAGDTISRAIPNFITEAQRGNPLIVRGASNRRDYLHVDDAARAIVAAVDKFQPGVFCIGTGHPVTIKRVALAVSSLVTPRAPVKEKRGSTRTDLVFTITKAREFLSFSPRFRFPDRLEEQLTRPIVFDLDGTILNAQKRYYQVYRDIIAELGYKPVSSRNYWTKRRNAAPIPHTQSNDFQLRFRKHIEDEKYLTLDTPYPEAIQALEALSERFPLYIVTLRQHRDRLMRQLNAFGLSRWFSPTHVLTPKKKGKVQALSHIRPRPFVVIGDTQVDIEAAESLGIAAIGVATGLRNRKFLSRLRPAKVLPNAKNLRAIIEQIYDQQSHDRHPRV